MDPICMLQPIAIGIHSEYKYINMQKTTHYELADDYTESKTCLIGWLQKDSFRVAANILNEIRRLACG